MIVTRMGRVRWGGAPSPSALLQLGSQVLLAILCPFLWMLLRRLVVNWNEITGSPLGSVGFQIVNALAMSIFSLTIGFVVGFLFSKAPTTGRWVWLVPCSILGLVIAHDVLVHWSWSGIWTNYFFWIHPGRDVAPLGIAVFTYPAASALFYSIGCYMAGRRKA